MKIIRAVMTSIDLQFIAMDVFEGPGQECVVTGLRLRGQGFLADGSEVPLDIEIAADEQTGLLAIFDRIAARVAADDEA